MAKRMGGAITTRHLLTQAPTIINEFGVGAYLKCVCRTMFSRKEVTFLECTCQIRCAPAQTNSNAPKSQNTL